MKLLGINAFGTKTKRAALFLQAFILSRWRGFGELGACLATRNFRNSFRAFFAAARDFDLEKHRKRV